MAGICSVIMVGRLTRDAELKYTKTGKGLASFSLAVNGFSKDEVDFFDVTAWGKIAESLTQYLTKGKEIALRGRLKQERWQAPDGANRSKIVVVAEDIQLLGGGKDE